MIIGILTYNSVYNFGANLQAISTAKYLQNNGFKTVFINWVPEELEVKYESSVSDKQKSAHISAKRPFMDETPICRTDVDIINVIKEFDIKGIIVGSDAVLQHFEIPLKTKLKFLFNKKGINKRYTKDRLFPNPYWGSFYKLLDNKIPIVVMSGSSQNANYKVFGKSVMKEISNNLSKFSYISVRDSWTRNMIAHITDDKITPEVTPDPVFAFNYNVPEVLENQKEILARFNLPEKYLLVSFKKKVDGVDDVWMQSLEKEANKRGYKIFALPLPEKMISYGLTETLPLPISPIEWYSLILNSSGYIGQNMHPIVVSLHNVNPFYSIDYYGLAKNADGTDSSSKISHILNSAGFSDYRVSSVNAEIRITPLEILNKIENFDKEKCKVFSEKYLDQYKVMMNEIINCLTV